MLRAMACSDLYTAKRTYDRIPEAEPLWAVDFNFVLHSIETKADLES